MILQFIRRYKYLRESGILTRNTIGVLFVNFVFQKIFGISRGFNYLIHFTSIVTSPKNVELFGNGYHAEKCLALNGGFLIQGSNGVRIHRTVLMAPGVKIISGNHDIDDFSSKSVYSPPIQIMENCWLGANSVILPGVTLLNGTIVGAGSVVVKGFNRENIVVAGNPARIVKSRIAK